MKNVSKILPFMIIIISVLFFISSTKSKLSGEEIKSQNIYGIYSEVAVNYLENFFNENEHSFIMDEYKTVLYKKFEKDLNKIKENNLTLFIEKSEVVSTESFVREGIEFIDIFMNIEYNVSAKGNVVTKSSTNVHTFLLRKEGKLYLANLEF